MSFLFLFFLLPLVLAALTNPSRTTVRRNNSPFIGRDGLSFTVNGRQVHGRLLLGVQSPTMMIFSDFRYIGTNAYWLPALNTNEDIWYTLGNISALGIKVVRLWAFNGEPFTFVDRT